MTAPVINVAVAPMGGIITLQISGAVSGAYSLSRQPVSGSYSVLVSGDGLCPTFYIDPGDGLPGPLSPSTAYQYQYTDPTGTTTTSPITPASTLQVDVDPLQNLIIRIIQAGMQSLTIPEGIGIPEVTQAMPLGGLLPLPLVVVNQDLFQQDNVPIGQSIFMQLYMAQAPYIITGLAKRVYRVSVLSRNAVERNFFRDNIVGMFVASYSSLLTPMGLDVEHRWQVASGQVASDVDKKMPGFFYAEIMLEFVGTFDVAISTAYGTIAAIVVTATGEDGSQTIVQAPVSG